MIHFKKVSKHYPGDVTALDDVTFSISSGEFISIVGHSGAGKTTLIKLLLIEEWPSEGTIFFEKIDIHKLHSRYIPAYRRRIGIVFQDFRLMPHQTAFENVAFAMEVAGRTSEDIDTNVPEVLELVDLGKKMWNFPRELSGGERQRIAIARAIVNEPNVLIADEPTGNLDPINTRDIVEILKRINDLKTTVILTTHNKGVIDALHKRVITLKDGKIIRDDKAGKYIL